MIGLFGMRLLNQASDQQRLQHCAPEKRLMAHAKLSHEIARRSRNLAKPYNRSVVFREFQSRLDIFRGRDWRLVSGLSDQPPTNLVTSLVTRESGQEMLG